MNNFDYSAEAELFPSQFRVSRTQSVGYDRFVGAAGAIRFAIDELPAESLAGASLEVGEDRFDTQGIRASKSTPGTHWTDGNRRGGAAPARGTGRKQDPCHRKAVVWRRS
jgi:hypothetical protein